MLGSRLISHFIILQLLSMQAIIIVCNPIKVLETGMLPLEAHSIAIQFFLDLENEDRLESCFLRVLANKCCLFEGDDVDCDVMKLVGRHDALVKPKDRKTFLFFYVTMFQLNHEGYCNFDVTQKCGLTSSRTEEIRVPFDTRLCTKETKYLFRNIKHQKMAKCKSIDEDPLNDCRPVNCDIKYAGLKPFYNAQKHRCIEAVKCVASPYKPLPDIVYEPNSNTCKYLDHSLSVVDIYAINSGFGTIIKSEQVSDNDVSLVVYKPNCSSISQNLQFLKELITGKLHPAKGYSIDFNKSCHDAVMAIFSTIVSISAVIILFVCCANTAFTFYNEWESGRLHERVEEFKYKMSQENKEPEEEPVYVNKEVKNKLLREVIVSDLPLELRNSVVDICERIGKEVRWKKRYRMIDDGSDINLRPVHGSSDTSTTSDLDISEKERILQ